MAPAEPSEPPPPLEWQAKAQAKARRALVAQQTRQAEAAQFKTAREVPDDDTSSVRIQPVSGRGFPV